MDVILYIIAIVLYVMARKYRDPSGNYYDDGIKLKNAALICLIIGIVLSVVGFMIGFTSAI
ncbi:MAG: hypothetical protein ACI4VF_09125 [Lachnospirales bacterium]